MFLFSFFFSFYLVERRENWGWEVGGREGEGVKLKNSLDVITLVGFTLVIWICKNFVFYGVPIVIIGIVFSSCGEGFFCVCFASTSFGYLLKIHSAIQIAD